MSGYAATACMAAFMLTIFEPVLKCRTSRVTAVDLITDDAMVFLFFPLSHAHSCPLPKRYPVDSRRIEAPCLPGYNDCRKCLLRKRHPVRTLAARFTFWHAHGISTMLRREPKERVSYSGSH
jgi:hypothetical protein